MDNDTIFITLQNSYDSLKYFNVKNNILYFKDNEHIYNLPLNIVNLYTLNNNLFLLKPRDIYRIIYLLELLEKENITENDIEFIKQYTEKYIKLEQSRIEKDNNHDIDENEVSSFSIPIYTSYDPRFANKPTSKIIDELLYKHTKQIEEGTSKGQKLVRINPNFPKEDEQNNYLSDFGKAGFTTLLLIIGTVIITSLYIAYYVIGN